MKMKKRHNMEEQKEQQEEQSKETNGQENVNQDNGSQDTTGKEQKAGEQEEDSLETKLEKSDALVAELQDRLLRQMAEFDNYRKRTIKEKADLVINGSAGVMTDILPVIDDLERAILNAGRSDDYNALKEGIELIYSKLMHTLGQKGLKKISPVNEPFDTDFHEAIAMIPAPDEKSKGLVLDCAIDGYMLNDKVLRHAKVAVAQ